MALAENTLVLHRPSLPAALSTYRGPDRRRASTAYLSSRSFTIGVPSFLVVSHVAAFAASQQGSWSVAGGPGATEWLTASVAVITALAGAMYVMRWRLAGDASALWVGAGLLVYSGANIAFPGLVQSFSSVDSEAQSWAGLLRPASVFVVMALLFMAAVGPAVHAGLRPRRVIGFAALGALVAMAAASASGDVRLLLGPAIDRPPSGGLGAFGQVGVAVLWLALATAFIFPLPWGGRRRAPWLGVMLMSLAEARLALAVSIGGDSAWMLTSQLFRLFGVAAALGGAFHQLQLAFTVQRANLLDSLAELGSAREARRAAEATAEERAHDLRSALTGIGGAAVTLERYHSRLSDDERASLARAVAAEIARLQQIVGDVRPAPRAFEVLRVLEPLLTCTGTQHAKIALDVPSGLIAFGRPSEVAEVVQNLVDNAMRHAGTAILVRARQRGASVEIRVEDHGPGIPRRDRQVIFERGWRGNPHTDGSGLGLFNARKLTREQHGALWVEDRTGGGASFVLALPSGTTREDAQ